VRMCVTGAAGLGDPSGGEGREEED
jgi:hypothetical protein